MSEEGDQQNYVKIIFELDVEDGWPPYPNERLWAEPLEDDLCRVENVPFFARGVGLHDVVAAPERDGERVVQSVVKWSGHSTIRLVFFDKNIIQQTRAMFRDVGCDSEWSNIYDLIAMDVPPEVDLETVRSMLKAGEEAGKWEYEEGCVPANAA